MTMAQIYISLFAVRFLAGADLYGKFVVREKYYFMID